MREANSPLEIALANAKNGWHVFPVTPQKIPYPGFSGWEAKATNDAETIATWWMMDYPDALPAVCPGRDGKAVIDVDRHEGKANGFTSLVQVGANIPVEVPAFTSLSGRGTHYWFRGDVTSRNGIYPGVDRKARGGYVVTPYRLPLVKDVHVRLTTALHGGEATTAQHPYEGKPGAWLADRAGMTPSPAVQRFLQGLAREAFTGHENLLRAQTHLVKLGREGHGGVPEALSIAREWWMAVPHASGDPHLEWLTALAGAINKFGGDNE